MKNNRIALIGLGWLGMPLAQELQSKGYRLTVSSRNEEKLTYIEAQCWIPLNFNSLSTPKLSENNEGDLKNVQHVIITLPPSTFKENASLLNILLEKFDPNCQVIYTSSTGIYPNENREYDESSVIETSSLLGDLEEEIKERSHYCILRLAGLIGPNRHPVKFLLKQETRENGAAVVNLIHQKDVIQAIVSCISQEKNQAIYNVCYPEHPTRAEYYNEAAKFYFQQEMTFNSGEKGKIILGKKIEKERKFKYSNKITDFGDLI
jgi:nucleoside-diphosphate-sugar epimerase